MFSLIAAIGKNRELGKDGELVFRIPEDMKYFRETTMGHKVLMGRKTWESLPKKLSGRENIVVSRNLLFAASSPRSSRPSSRGSAAMARQRPAQCAEVGKNTSSVTNNKAGDNSAHSSKGSIPDFIVSNLSDFVTQHKDSEEEIFVIGGGMVYWEMMKYAKKLYLTEVEAEAEADTFFPEFDKSEWTRTVIKEGEDNGIKYAFVLYERK